MTNEQNAKYGQAMAAFDSVKNSGEPEDKFME